MMQEVGSSDDTNGGESTFEFVDRKMDELQLSVGNGSSATTTTTLLTSTENTESASSSSVRATDQSPNEAASSLNPLLPPSPSSSTWTPSQTSPAFASQLPTAVPPPASLPAFLGSGSSVQSPLKPSYVVPPFSPTNTPLMAQPSYSMAPAQIPYAGGSSTTLDLGGGYADPFPRANEDFGAQGSGMWGWIKGTVSGNDFLSKVAEKAKNSVDTMITTLDPQMKQYIYSGGDIDVVIASDKDDKIIPIRDSFQMVFGRATVTGMSAQGNIAAQPVGFSAGVKGAENRIAFLRQSGMVHERQPVIAVENFLADLTPERWYDIGCLVLDDPAIGEPIHVYTQATPVPIRFVNMLREETRNDYPLRWSGFAITIGSVVGRTLQVPRTEWHEYFCGVSRRDMISAASKTLATAYRQKLQEMGSGGRITVQ